jgi:hypothetical protein
MAWHRGGRCAVGGDCDGDLIGDRGVIPRSSESFRGRHVSRHRLSGGNIAILPPRPGALWIAGLRGRGGAAVAIECWSLARSSWRRITVMRATMVAITWASPVRSATAPWHAMALTAASLLLVAAVDRRRRFLADPATARSWPARRVTLQPTWIGPAIALVARRRARRSLMPVGAMIFQRVTMAGLAPTRRRPYGGGADRGAR